MDAMTKNGPVPSVGGKLYEIKKMQDKVESLKSGKRPEDRPYLGF